MELLPTDTQQKIKRQTFDFLCWKRVSAIVGAQEVQEAQLSSATNDRQLLNRNYQKEKA